MSRSRSTRSSSTENGSSSARFPTSIDAKCVESIRPIRVFSSRSTVMHFEANNVVVAAGIGTFARRPPQFASFDSDVVSHTVEQRDLSVFRGRRVSVIGGGQSALESAALLHESGADVDVLVRAESVRWILGQTRRAPGPWLNHLLYGPAAVGPAGLSQLNEHPASVPADSQRDPRCARPPLDPVRRRRLVVSPRRERSDPYRRRRRRGGPFPRGSAAPAQ